MEDSQIKKRHNKSLLLYHFVCPTKYRRKVFTKEVDQTLEKICKGIEKRYEIKFVEIGSDEDHIHFLLQSVPSITPTEIIRTVKSITAIKIFENHPDVKKKLWGGTFWTSGFYVNTVGQYGNLEIIQKYVRNQDKKYSQIYRGQLKLF
jgi:REP-associated tyrosine transposase